MAANLLNLRSAAAWMTLGIGLLLSLSVANGQAPDPQLVNASSISCSFTDDAQIAECIQRGAPAINWRNNHQIAADATFSLEVKFLSLKDTTGAVRTSYGTAFLVDKAKRYFVTAKHVLLGNKIAWSTAIPSDHGFADFESAMEDYLKGANADIQARPDGYTQYIKLSLVALDRSSDLALLQAARLGEFPIFQRSYFRAHALAEKFECAGGLPLVFALGYTQAPPAAPLKASAPELAGCDIIPKNAYLGDMRYRFTLFDTKSDFEAGMSGGPVLDYPTLKVVGVVSGSAVGSSRKFFTPLSAIKAFLSRF